MLYKAEEGGPVKMSGETVYICRICEMTPKKAIKSKQKWMKHLESHFHQQHHRHHPMLRKALWDQDRTVSITGVKGIYPQSILDYIITKSNINLVDFSVAQTRGNTDVCYALLSST